VRGRRLAGSACLGILAVAGLSPALAGCGASGQLSVTLAYPKDATGGPFQAGGTAQFELTVTNNGPGDADGILLAVDMPSSFRYKETDSLPPPTGGTGGVRTEPLNAKVGSTSPTWGYWDLGAPSGGSLTTIDMKFTVEINGTPGSYNVTPRAQSENTAGTIDGKPLVVVVNPSAERTVTEFASAAVTTR